MSKSNYMRLGDCICPIDVRNRDMISDKPMGINIDKFFMPSVANVVGTDLSNYKVVEKNQFACNLMHVGRDERLPIAILEQEAPIIVSPAYYVFEIKPGIPLMPSFLMLWFKRPEFDRNAWFYTDADVRGGLDRDSFLDMEIPVPNIDEQRRIVAEYQAVEKRIATNEALIVKLEETAQIIYKDMFVNNVDLANLPNGWIMGTLENLGEIVSGATPSTEVPEYWDDSGIAWLSPADLSREGTLFMSRGAKSISALGYKSASTKLLPKGGVLFSSRAPIGLMAISDGELCTNQGFKSIVPNSKVGTEYIYYVLLNLRDRIANENTGATFAEVSGSTMKMYEALIPDEKTCKEFSKKILPLHDYIKNIEQENKTLTNLLSLLLSKLTK